MQPNDHTKDVISNDELLFETSRRRLAILQQQISLSNTLQQQDDHNSNASAVVLDSSQLVLRTLEPDDYHKGYLQLLSQLTNVGEVDQNMFEQRFNQIRQLYGKDTCFLFVIEDRTRRRIVACATLLIELKFLHQCSSVAHVEDVVVDRAYRGYRLGQRLMDACKQKAQEHNCYKIILDCSEDVAPFYESCGFEQKGYQMRMDLPH